MMEGIKEESVGNLFNVQVEVAENQVAEDAADGAAAVPPALRQAPPATRPGQQPAPAGAPGPAGGAGNAPGNGASRGRHRTRGRGAQAAGARPGGDQPGGTQPSGAEPGRAQPSAARPGRGRSGRAQPGGAGTPSVVAPGLNRPERPSRLSYSAPSSDGGGQVERRTESPSGDKFAKVGRNAPCPCGSGRKYKLCHGDPRNRVNGQAAKRRHVPAGAAA